jgi:hypothetical protein
VVTQRIKTRLLINEFLSNYLGWDNSFFFTFRMLLSSPATVISEYLGGVRKRYMAPIVFIGFGVALGSIVYNTYADEYLSMTNSFSESQFTIIQDRYDDGKMTEEEYQFQKENLETNKKFQQNFLKYFNIISFLSLPIYALISLLVFGRKLTYGEHLVTNCYLQGLSFITGIFLFLGSVYVWSPLIFIQFFFIMPFYLWTYAKLLDFGWGKALLKFLLFLGILIGVLLVFVIIGVALVLATKLAF